jgi:pyridoxal phosphate enzyme (YggS family)
MNTSRKDELSANLQIVKDKISAALHRANRKHEELTLVVVSKNFPVEDAQFLYELGVRDFGENRDHEGALKAPILPGDVNWHFQGQIQSRKIPSIGTWARTIHSLDSLEHAKKFADRGAGSHQFFLQVNCEEAAEHRGGVQISEIEGFLDQSPVAITGLMVVPPLHSQPRQIFRTITALGKKYELSCLSMGMSGDYEIAIEEGATHIRVGSSILGSRPIVA